MYRICNSAGIGYQMHLVETLACQNATAHKVSLLLTYKNCQESFWITQVSNLIFVLCVLFFLLFLDRWAFCKCYIVFNDLTVEIIQFLSCWQSYKECSPPHNRYCILIFKNLLDPPLVNTSHIKMINNDLSSHSRMTLLFADMARPTRNWAGIVNKVPIVAPWW